MSVARRSEGRLALIREGSYALSRPVKGLAKRPEFFEFEDGLGDTTEVEEPDVRPLGADRVPAASDRCIRAAPLEISACQCLPSIDLRSPAHDRPTTSQPSKRSQFEHQANRVMEELGVPVAGVEFFSSPRSPVVVSGQDECPQPRGETCRRRPDETVRQLRNERGQDLQCKSDHDQHPSDEVTRRLSPFSAQLAARCFFGVLESFDDARTVFRSSSRD